MSSWNDVYSGLRSNLITALNGVVEPANVTIGFPASVVMLSSGQPVTNTTNSINSLGPLVAIYDRGFSKDTTRWLPRDVVDWAYTAPTVSFSVNSLNIPPLGSGSVTVTGAALNDAIGVQLLNNDVLGVTDVFMGETSASQVAASIASVIGGAFTGVLTATSSGGILTVTNISPTVQTVNFAAANMASSLYEVKRTRRSGHVVAMANSPQVLDTIGEPISQMLGYMETTFGYELPDGTYVRVINNADACFWDNALNNIARRDWLVELEYGVTMQDNAYAVLASIFNWSVVS